MKKKGTFLFDYVNSHMPCHEEFVWELIYKTGTYCHYTALKQKKKYHAISQMSRQNLICWNSWKVF